MSTYGERQRLDLANCLASFDEQFQLWADRTLRPPWETHYSQVRAVTSMMDGVRVGLKERLDSTNGTPAAADLPTFVLAAWRVWEAFRSRLAQRQEDAFRSGLAAADEIAWACRKPIAAAVAAAGGAVPPEPALVYLSGAASPVALQRHTRFLAEPVFGQSLTAAANALLEKLPVPLIGLPWHEIFHAPGMVAIAHEAGHVVEADFELTAPLDAAIQRAADKCGQPSSVWLPWRAEIFADHFAMRHCGPAFVTMLGDVLLSHVDSTGPSYPPHVVRMELCFAALKDMGIPDAQVDALKNAWKAEYERKVAAPPPPVLVARVAAATEFATELGRLPVANSTLNQLISFGPPEQTTVEALAGQLQKHELPPPGTLATQIAAAARVVFDQDPTFFNDSNLSLFLCGAMLKGPDSGSRRRAGRPRDVLAAAAAPIVGAGVDAKYFAAGKRLVSEIVRRPPSPET